MDHEGHVRGTQHLGLVEVDQVEQKPQFLLLLDVCEDGQPREQLEGVDQPVVVRVPEGLLHPEDVLEFV